MTISLFQKDRSRERVEQVLRMPTLGHNQRRVLQILAAGHMGKARAIPIRRLSETIALTEREIKDIVRTLRQAPYRVPVASSRDGKAGGLFLAATDDERREAAEYMVRQAQSELELAVDMLEPGEFHTATTPIRTLLAQGGDRG